MPIIGHKPDRKEKIKFSKCLRCFNCIDSESPGFESELCSQCWFWHQAKVSFTFLFLSKSFRTLAWIAEISVGSKISMFIKCSFVNCLIT